MLIQSRNALQGKLTFYQRVMSKRSQHDWNQASLRSLVHWISKSIEIPVGLEEDALFIYFSFEAIKKRRSHFKIRRDGTKNVFHHWH